MATQPPHKLWTGELRTKVRDAESAGIRALKVAVEAEAGPDGHMRLVLTLKGELQEDKSSKGPADELSRALSMLVESEVPCYILFRVPACEHVFGHRWVVISWSPETAKVADLALQARGRGIIARLMSNTFHFHEVLASEDGEAMWESIKAAMQAEPLPITIVEEKLTANRLDGRPTGPPPAPVMQQMPLKGGHSVESSISRLKSQANPCVKLVLNVKSDDSVTLEGSALACRTPSQLQQQVGQVEPAYFVISYVERILFILWCPELADAKTKMRYAMYKTAALQLVLQHMDNPKLGVKMVQASVAREDLADLIAIDPNASDPPPLQVALLDRPAATCRSGKNRTPKSVATLKAVVF